MAKWFMISGALLLAVGVILHFAPWMFNWFGRLPGDIRIESERGKIFFPVTSMLIISIILSIIINLFKR